MNNVTDLVLDGNATAYLLELIFTPDITLAKIRCKECDSVSTVGSLIMYAAPMGAVLKCADCESDLIKAVDTPHGLWVEMTGARSLRFVRPPIDRFARRSAAALTAKPSSSEFTKPARHPGLKQ